ncbi:MAG: hypothetical protein JHC22_01800 [Thermoproteus sp.]|jgi:hypothetical protein|nr:hypothetical protein [Thermoproteus sp.]
MRALAALLLLAAPGLAAFWSGPVAVGLPQGYGMSIAALGGSAYLYYTALGNGPVLSGLVLSGPSYAVAPAPRTGGPAASPYVFQLSNGSLAMLWIELGPAGSSSLEMSILSAAGWSAPVGLISGGAVLAYASDGRLIYAVWQPAPDPTYASSRLVVIYPNGSRLSLREPGLAGLNGAYRGGAMAVFANGTYAVVGPDGSARRVEAQYAGLSPGGLYVLSGGVFRYGNASLEVPWASAAAPVEGCGGPFAVAWSASGRVAVYAPGGLSLRNFAVPGAVRSVGAVCAGGFLYVAVESVANHSGSIWVAVVPTTPAKPSISASASGPIASVAWSVPYPDEYNVTSTTLLVYINGALAAERPVAPRGTAAYEMSKPGNYTFVLLVSTPFGNATASATLISNATATTAAPQTAATQTSTATTSTATAAAEAATSTQPQTSKAAGGHGLAYALAGTAAIAAALIAWLAVGRRRGAGPRRGSADAPDGARHSRRSRRRP